jgi:hypothetical protein
MRRANQVNALWPQVFQLPECAGVVGRREATIRIFLAKLARVLAETAHRAHVLTLDRYRIAGLEAVADAIAPAGLGPGRGLTRRPGTAFHQGAWRDAAVGIRLGRFGLRWFREVGWGRRAWFAWLTSPAEGVDLPQVALEIDALLDVADVDDFLERNEEIGLAETDDPHVTLARHKKSLRRLRRAVEDLAHNAELAIARLHRVANPDDPLDYGHDDIPTVMEPRVL